MRGKPSDYDKWVQETGDQRWGWDSILKNYINLENNQRLGASISWYKWG